jgi:histidyl-tRNA synthetase
MVRGLDYYERTAWEWVLPGGGSQAGTISGGGRYDGLAEQIGGKRVPGVGFGCGIERVVLALEEAGQAPRPAAVDWFCACSDESARPALHALVDAARARGLACQADLAGRSEKGQLRHGERLGARVITLCRAGDGARGIVRHGEAEIAFGDVVDHVERSVRGE